MKCFGLPEIEYGDFARALKSAQGGRTPLFASMELTFQCNLRCAHCYVRGPANRGEELGTREITGLIDQFVEAGLLWLHLTGGEPLMRPDFEDIYLYAKSKGLILVLFTNGTRITPRLADLLREYPPIAAEITLYGATRETHERVTGVSGSFERCLRGIDLLLDQGVRLKLKTMLLTLNEHELEGMRALAEARGVAFRYDTMINAGLSGSKTPCSLRIPPERVLEIERRDRKRIKELKEFTWKYWGPPKRDFLFSCGAGTSSFHVDPFGNLSPCMMARFRSYSLRNGSFRQAWDHFLPELRELRKSRVTECDTCELAPLCGQCPGWAHLEHGDPEEPVEYLCELAHLRSGTLGLDGTKEVNDETVVSQA